VADLQSAVIISISALGGSISAIAVIAAIVAAMCARAQRRADRRAAEPDLAARAPPSPAGSALV